MIKLPFTMFGQTKNVRLITHTKGKNDNPPKRKWSKTLWIERPEDEYALMSDEYKNITVRLVYRNDWVR